MSRAFPAAAALLLAACAPAAPSAPSPGALPPALEAVTREELRRDLFALAGDSMRGRLAGTLDEMRASAWVAERAREAGLEPAGDDGTYFQFFPVRRVRLAATSRVEVNGRPLRLWEEAAVAAPVDAVVDAPLLFVGRGGAGEEARGRVVVADLLPPATLPHPDISLREWRYAVSAVRERAAALAKAGPAAIVLVADPPTESAFEKAAHGYEHGRYLLDQPGTDGRPAAEPPVILLRRGVLERAGAEPGGRFTARLASESFTYPSVNVVARVPGRDPALRGEHVLFSAHQDHDGVRYPVNGDSIWNGADDNATTSVALLAIGRAFARAPGRRSALFVWHGAEERGLLGSRWHAERPVVPRESIVAVLNGDMLGRNHPDTAALLGAVPPHRNSAALVEMAREANARVSRFVIDTSWDDPAHPEFWYFRSDHLPYARAGIPALFFTTLLHPDYHTPEDEAERIDLDKLLRVTRWMYATGWAVASADRRPAVDPGFRLER